MDKDILGGTPTPESTVQEKVDKLLSTSANLEDCLVIPPENLPDDNQIAVVTALNMKRFAFMSTTVAQDLKDERAFLHCLQANGLSDWDGYDKAVKAFKKQQYGENN